MDFRQFNNYIEGFVDRRETGLNDNKSLIKTHAANIAMAVWGNKKFNQSIPDIKLRGETRASKIAKALNALGVTLDGLDAYMKRKEIKDAKRKQSKQL